MTVFIIARMEIRTQLYRLLQCIPHDRVATYGQLARLLNKRKNARHIGRLLGQNDHPDMYPCYKVVAADGSLTGYSAPGGIRTKREMLLSDGIVFKINGKVDLAVSGWKS